MSRKPSKDKKKKINISQSLSKKDKRNTEPVISVLERNNEVSSEDNDLQKVGGPNWRSLPRSATKPSAEPSSTKELTRYRSLSSPGDELKSSANEPEKVKESKKQKNEPTIEHFQPRIEKDFILLSKIVSTSTGTIYRAHPKEKSSEIFAIKKITFPHFDETMCSYDKILQEVKVLTTLSHPNIIKYYQSWMEFDEKGLIFGETDFSLENNLPSSGSYPLTHSSLFRNNFADELSLSDSVDSSITAITFTEYALTSDTDAFDEDPADDATDTDFVTDSNPFAQDDLSSHSSTFPVKTVTLYLQMELCPVTLKDYLDQRREVNESYSLQIFTQILLALKYIHSLNIIHGDLNPTNIYIHSKSKFSEMKCDTVKIGDFSICLDELPCVLSDENLGNYKYNCFTEDSEDTNASELTDKSDLTTNEYASPELRRGSQCCKATDIFSVGVIIFELFYCVKQSARDKLLKDLRRRVLPPNLLLTNPNLAAVVLWMMSPNPIDRPTAREILECKLFENHQVSEQITINKKELEDLDKKIQSQESTIHQQENIIKEQEKMIKELMSGKGKKDNEKH